MTTIRYDDELAEHLDRHADVAEARRATERAAVAMAAARTREAEIRHALAVAEAETQRCELDAVAAYRQHSAVVADVVERYHEALAPGEVVI